MNKVFEPLSVDELEIMAQLIRRDIIEMIAEAMTWYPSDFPMCLDQIVLAENHATVYGHRR